MCNPVGVMTIEIQPTRVAEFIKQMMPLAHGHQIKAISKFVLAIIEKQTGCQAELALAQGNQEAAAKQLSRSFTTRGSSPKISLNGFACRSWPIRSREAAKCAWRLIGRVKMTNICSSFHLSLGGARHLYSGALTR
jgi:hypothetical protein